MKKYLILLLILTTVVIASAQVAKAEDSTVKKSPVPAPLTPAEEAAFRAEKAKVTQLEQIKAEQQLQSEKSDKENAVNMKIAIRANITDQLTQKAENLSKIADKITTRIQKLQTQNIDTSFAESLVAQAEANIDTAKSNINDIKTAMVNGDTSDSIKASITETTNLLQSTYDFLNEAVAKLKMQTEDKPKQSLQIQSRINASLSIPLPILIKK